MQLHARLCFTQASCLKQVEVTRTVLMQLLTSRLPAAFLLRLCEYLTARMLDVLDMNYAVTSAYLRPSTLFYVSLFHSATLAQAAGEYTHQRTTRRCSHTIGPCSSVVVQA